MSRSIDAEIVEPGAVNMARLRSIVTFDGGNPFAVAMAQHSSYNPVVRLTAPAATISPKDARIRQVMPAPVAMKAHFSHISCMIAALRLTSKPAPDSAARIARARADLVPSCSPNER